MTDLRAWWGHPRVGPALKVIVGYLVLVEVVLQLSFGKIRGTGIGRGGDAIPVEVLLAGAVIGLLYSLVAMGLILVYRANRIINFAQAQLGAVPAVVALLLMRTHGVPYWLAIVIALAGGAVIGAATEVIFIRRFATSPRLILTVATVGVSLVLLILEFYSKSWLSSTITDLLDLGLGGSLLGIEVRLGAVTFTGHHLAAVVVAVGIMLLLAGFFRYTDVGIAIRASAESGERASLLGIPVRRMSTIVWTLAAVLSAAAVFLRAPIIGLPLGGFTGPAVLLFGLSAAVVARMESIPLALFAGLFIGMIHQSVLFATGRIALTSFAMLILVVASLLAQRKRLSRAFDVEASTWLAVKELRPIPTELRRLPQVRKARAVLYAIIAMLVIGAPHILGSDTSSATIMVIYAMVGVSLVVLTGWSGQISLGQYAIAGVGAAVAAGLAAEHGWDFFAALVAGAAAGAVVAVILGLPALRIRGLFLAVTTLAFAFAVQTLLTREYVGWLLPRSGSQATRPALWGRIDLETASDFGPFRLTADAKYYYVCAAFLALTLAMGRSFRNNRSGRVLLTIRDNEKMAQSFGINVAATRLAAFAISGFIAGLAGALLAYQNRVIASNAFPPERSIEIFVMTVIGGIGSLPGAIFGAIYVLGLPLLPGLRDIDQISLLTTGLGLLLLLNFVPGGIAEAVYRLRDRWLRVLATRQKIVVPSLVTDQRVMVGDRS